MIKIFGLSVLLSCFLGSVLTTAALAQTVPTPASDAEVAEILMTVNDGEIDAGQLAGRKAQNQGVKDFAKVMVDEHKANNKETKAVAQKADLKTKSTDFTKSLKDEAKQMNKSLKETEKSAFDKAYVDSQVKMHEKALSLLRDTLIPTAKNAELKAHLQKTATSVESHLGHVKGLQAKIQ